MKNPLVKVSKRSWYRVTLTILIVTAIVVLSYFLTPQKQGIGEPTTLSYSQLLEKVQSGEIKKVNIDSYLISGLLADQRFFTVTIHPGHVKPVEDLQKYKVDISFNEPLSGNNYWLLPYLGLVSLWVYFFFWGIGPRGGLNLGFWKSKNNRITFADVAGIDEAKEELMEVVEFLKNPEKFKHLGALIPKGVLLLGPPGVGKTLLARAIAGEASVPFYHKAGSEFVQMFVGVGSWRMRRFFRKGKSKPRCLLYIDEIDAVGKKRSETIDDGGAQEYDQTLNQMLTEMDGFEKYPGVVLIASTNRPDMLDPALLRPGRFDRQVAVSKPDAKGREAILRVHVRLRNVPLDENVDLLEVAKLLPGYSGADCEGLLNEAALNAARFNRRTVNYEDFSSAKDKILLGKEKKSHTRVMEEVRIAAFHEAGHSIVAAIVKEAAPIEKVTTIQRGFSGGGTHFVPSENQSLKLKQLNATIAVALGGRVAEQIFLDDITTGAQNDFEQAVKIVQEMVCSWGMSSLGPVFIDRGVKSDLGQGRVISGVQSQYSEQLKHKIENACFKMIENAERWAKKVVIENKELCQQIAQTLLEKEIMDGAEIYRMVGTRRGTLTIDDLEKDVEFKTEA